MSDTPDPASTPIAPMPVPGNASSVILFGGSFDPITRAHVQMAARARDLVDPSAWLVFIPAKRNPLKRGAPEGGDEDRVRMIRLAIRGLERAGVWTDEIERGGASFMIDTIARARAVLGDRARLRLLIGGDQAADFHRWKDARRIIELAPPIVMPRGAIAGGEDLARALRATGAWSDEEIARWRGWMVEMDEIDASATDVRRLLHAGRVDEAGGLLDDGVLGYIRGHGLYRTA